MVRHPRRRRGLLIVGLCLCLITCACIGLVFAAGAAGTWTWTLGWGNNAWPAALLGGCVAALATAIGTLPVLLSTTLVQRRYDGFLGFGAGVMLAACTFSLLLPALVAARAAGAGPLAASLRVGVSLCAGAALLLLLEWRGGPKASMPASASASASGSASASASASVSRSASTSAWAAGSAARTLSYAQASARSLRRAWLFALAVSLHNLPEGLAIGVAYGGAGLRQAHALTAGIAIQDIPEGCVVALALRGVGYSRGAAAGYGIGSGLLEPLAALAGVALVGLSQSWLPWALAAAAGAMLFVLVHDVIPETQSRGHGALASCAAIAGFVLMTVLDTGFA